MSDSLSGFVYSFTLGGSNVLVLVQGTGSGHSCSRKWPDWGRKAESNLLGTQQPLPEVNSSSYLEGDLLARARAVCYYYEFAKPGIVETDERRKRQQRNQTRISEQEKRLRGVVEHLPQSQINKKWGIQCYSCIWGGENDLYIQFLLGLQGRATGVQGENKHVNSLQKRFGETGIAWIQCQSWDFVWDVRCSADANSQGSTNCACALAEAWRYGFKRALHCIPTGCARTGN